MAQYMISFDEGAMAFPEEDLPDVAAAAHAVIDEAMEAAVFVFGGGLLNHEEASAVATDGAVTGGRYPKNRQCLGGFTIVDVPSREEAHEWAAKIAAACRCTQDVREFMPDPSVHRAPTTAADPIVADG